MKSTNDTHQKPADLSASEWLVALDAEAADQATNDAFIEWLRKDPRNQTDFEQCEALLTVTGKLKDDEDLAWAFRESAEIAAGKSAQKIRRPFTPWFAHLGLGIGAAGLALVAVAAVFVGMNADEATETVPPSTGPMADTPAALEGPIGPEVIVLPVQTAPQRQTVQFRVNDITNDQLLPAGEPPTALDTQIAETQAEFDRLRLQYIEQHPRVAATKARLDDLVQQRKQTEYFRQRTAEFQQADQYTQMRGLFDDTAPPENLPITNPVSGVTFSTDPVRVLGAVRTPGAVPYREGMTLRDLVLQVGGLSDSAAGNRGQLLRIVNGEEIETPLRLDELAIESDLFEFTPILPGDVIIVPEIEEIIFR